jgi:hypothetical protein
MPKNLVNSVLNSKPGREFCQFRPTFPDKPLLEHHVTLCKSLSPIVPLQLLYLDIFNFDLEISSFAILKSAAGNKMGAGVTEPPKIIPYYRLSRSTWPLSNNKELLSRFRRVKPGKSHTTGSLICAEPTRRRDQSTTLHYVKGSKFNIITNQVFHT